MTSILEKLKSAMAQFRQGDAGTALATAETVLKKQPQNLDALLLAGQIYHARKDYFAAGELLGKALELAPDQPDLMANLAAVFLAMGDTERSEMLAQRAARIAPDHFGARFNLGLARLEGRHYGAAARALQKALEIRPDDLPVMQNLARAQYRGGTAHMSCRPLLEQLIERAPGDWEMRALLADSYVQNAETETGLSIFRELLEGGPEIPAAQKSRYHSSYLIALQYRALTTAGQLQAAHKRWAELYSAEQRMAAPVPSRKKLRIGWLSPRFGAGPVASFFLPVLAAFERKRSEHFLYSAFPHEGSVNARFKALADAWRDLDGKSPEQVAQIIATDELDVLVDLAGHAPGGQLPALSRKPAPLQISWLDSFCTTGLEAMDVFLSDAFLSPDGDDHYFVENLERLESGRLCYRPTRTFPEPAPRPENAAIVFACFNRLSKLNDAVLVAWAQILAALPGSRLELRNSLFDDPQVCDFFVQRCKRSRLPTERLSLHGICEYPLIMNAYRAVDIALDPFPFSGCTTSCDALWMGVPVVTCTGNTLVSRQSGAILEALDLGALIAQTQDEYVAAAVALAHDRTRLYELRMSLRSRMEHAFDPPRFADQLLSRFEKMLSGTLN